jgi:cobalt-zinc-cadmium efflux system membrane fusion protein
MRYRLFISLIAFASGAVLSSENPWLTLSPLEIDRLGITLAYPEPAGSVELGAGPAEIVIPPAQQAVVSAPIGGVINRLLVAEGESVRAGQALAEIQSVGLLAMQRQFVEALSDNELALAQLERDRGLRMDGIIADKRLQETQAAARAAAVALDQMRQQLALAGHSDADIDRLANRRELSATLTLRAPFDGIAIGQHPDLGARIESLDPVYRIADLSQLWLEMHIPQERAARMRIGHYASVAVDGQRFDAKLIHLGHVVDSASQTVLARAVIENQELRLRAGQYLPARIFFRPDAETGPVLAVPATAVVRDGGQTFVFVRVAEGFAVRSVSLIAEDNAFAYLSTGIEPRSEIAITGVAVLKSIWFENRTMEETP